MQKLNSKDKTKILEDFKKMLFSKNGNFIYNVEVHQSVKLKQKLEVAFTKKAFEKMRALIDNTAGEIAWHGTVERTEKGFLITDILCYPQTVTSATVRVDDTAYAIWSQEIPDETYNKMHFQAHSHGDIGAFPSAADTEYYETMITNLKTAFYIFMITNKKKEYWIKVYDYEKQCLYDKDDINIITPTPYKDWAKEQIKQYVKTNRYIPKHNYIQQSYFDNYFEEGKNEY